MLSNPNKQPAGDQTPWYKRSIDFSNIDWKKIFSFKGHKKRIVSSAVKLNIKDIRSKSKNDGVDGIGVENPEILDIDLIKDEVPVIFEKKKNLYTLGAFAILSFFLVFEVYFFLYSWERQEIRKKATALEEEVARLDQEIASYRTDAAPATDFRNKITSASPLFNNHIYWNNLFSFLERNTLADVYYSGFSGDTSGAYALHSWVKDFRAISFQLKTVLNDNHVANAKISNEEVNGGDQSLGVKFDLGISVKPGIFTE